jgi:hypothetical protein
MGLPTSVIQALVSGYRHPVAITDDGPQQNYAPGGTDAWNRAVYMVFDPVGDLTIGGLAAPSGTDAVRTKTLLNIGIEKNIRFVDEDAGSSAANRILHPLSVDLRLQGESFPFDGGFLIITYDDIAARWRPVYCSTDDIGTPASASIMVRRADGEWQEITFDSPYANLFFSTDAAGVINLRIGALALPGLYLPSTGTTTVEQTLDASNPAVIQYDPGVGLDANVTLISNYTQLVWIAAFGVGNLTAGQRGRLKVIQDGTGSRTVAAWNVSTGSVRFVGSVDPTLSTAPGAVDLFDWHYDGTDVWVLVGLNMG